MSFCPSCGTSNADGVRFCGECGADIGQGETSAPVGGVQADRPVVSDISKALGGMDQRKAIIAGVVVVAFIVAYIAFVKPLSAAEYEERAEKYVLELDDAVGEINGTLSNFDIYENDGDDKLTELDLDELRSTYEESRSLAEDAAREIRDLRPPKEYKTADRRLNEGAKYYSEDYWNGIDDLINGAERETYDEFEASIDDFYIDADSRRTSAQRELNRAVDDLGFTLSGGE